MVEDDEGTVVVGEAADGGEAWRLITELRPDVAILDVAMPVMTGVEVARRVQESDVATAVIGFSGWPDEAYVLEMLKAGAAGYLTKDCTEEEFACAVRGAVEGRRGIMSAKIAQQVADRCVASLEGVGVYGTLSEREIEVLALLMTGKSNKRIAEELHITEGTVKNHASVIYTKLGVKDRREATVWAERHGIARMVNS
jgi:DNA-binding NarL/FixJ family response regulator